jgi:hypothetical protein
VHIQTGYLQSRAWAVGSVNNAGQTFSVGGGIHQMVGGATATSSIANVFNGAGGTMFVGSGQLRFIGVAQARAATAQSQYGTGLVSHTGAGTTNFIFNQQCSAQVGAFLFAVLVCSSESPFSNPHNPSHHVINNQTARAQFCAGNDIFLGAGWHTSVNTTRYGAQVASSFHGTGNQVMSFTPFFLPVSHLSSLPVCE